MQIVYRSVAGDQELDITLRNPDATLGDLVRVVHGAAVTSVAVNGRSLPASCPITDSGLHDGAWLTVPPAPLSTRPTPSSQGLELLVVAGLSSGRAFPLPKGRSAIGRHPSNGVVFDDVGVSRHHFEIDVDQSGIGTITDLGSSGGTALNGERLSLKQSVDLAADAVIEFDVHAVTIRATRTDDRPRALDLRRHAGGSGTVPFNRPPRVAAPVPASPLEVPTEPGETAKPEFSWSVVIGPLVLAVVLIAVTRDVRFALFALLSPVLAVGMWLESRRRSSRKGRRERAEYEFGLADLKQNVHDANIADRARSWQLCPDVPEVLRRAALPSVRLWERRRHHQDFLVLFAGVADITWRPPLEGFSTKLPSEIASLPESQYLSAAPATVDLSGGGVVGIVGDRAAALAVARSLVCQAAVHHGPADLTIAVFADAGRELEWEWSKWLPHTRTTGAAAGARWLAAGRDPSDALLRQLVSGAGTGTVLLVLDSDTLTEGKDSPARTLLSENRNQRDSHSPTPGVARVAGIVLADTVDRLPAVCNTVLELNQDCGGLLKRPDEGIEIGNVLAAGLTKHSARDCARDLARFEDPELHLRGGDLPDQVRLLPLLGLDHIDPESVRKRWRSRKSDAHPVAPLGVTEKGVFTLDLVDDGPHGLVGGTTGSGKSELLRTLVAALAAGADPAHLTFVLIDYKGGAAFDECSRLPHTVGMVTDLDEQLGERALRALEAELHHRERLLRTVSADNIQEYLALAPQQPMPRLVVVIDEFATMAKELPDFISSLVGIAQRGRTLGVHMILATQRPSGAVDDNIRANTNLRISLRVQDAADSMDVIGVQDAAAINRMRRGRAYARLGPGEIVPIQTALITCVTEESADVAIDVAPFIFGPMSRAEALPGAAPPRVESPSDTKTDLARLVDAIIEANELEGLPAARRPWPEPLPSRIDLAELDDTAAPVGAIRAMVARADDPRRQAQYPVGWNLAEGNLLLFGIPGSGTTTTLVALALRLVATHRPDELELHVFDYGIGELSALEGLPHTGSVVLAGDRERQIRLLRHLFGELGRRRLQGRDATIRRLVVLIDNFATMRATFTDTEGLELMDQLARVFADGLDVGIYFAIAADRLNTVPSAFTTTQRWLFRLADSYDYVSANLQRKDVPHPTPGRAVMTPSGLHIQVGLPTPSLAAAVATLAERFPATPRVATSIGTLPAQVSLTSLTATSRLSSEPWRIPLGIAESDLGVAALQLYDGEHALVAGPARSGKSTTLWTIAESLRHGDTPVYVAATGRPRSPLRDCPALDRFAPTGGEATALLAQLRTRQGPVVLLIDDAETFDDVDSAISTLLSAGLADLRIIAAANNDAVRSLYSHWTKTVRRSKAGVLLRPNIDLDGDLLGATLPRRAPVQMTPGRGYLITNGDPGIVQVATTQPG
ncbi:MAG: FtsK/SpoIIIE domain-containing protein [Pseudonocardiaceae bacterium]